MNIQTTIEKPFEISGKGLHTGRKVNVRLLPAGDDFGIRFKRIDLENTPYVEADARLVGDTSRGTSLEQNGVRVCTIEHLMAALFAMEIDNVEVELDAEEVPILDGSSRIWVEGIRKSGIAALTKPRKCFELKEPLSYSEPESGIELLALPYDGFRVDLYIEFASQVVGSQSAVLGSLSEFEQNFASCRTFVFLSEIEQLLKLNLIKGGDLDNAIIFADKVLEKSQIDHLAEVFSMNADNIKIENGVLNNVCPKYDNEPARHKLLDFIGDIALTGRHIKARFIVRKPGHRVNNQLARKIKNTMEDTKKAPFYDPNKEPVYDIKAIKQHLPHRFPMLLVDKIIEIGDDYVVGLKNVTANEDFFNGHFPEEPVMPGVLVVEALGQTGGMLALKDVEDPEEYSTYFMKFEEVKFRDKVVPGDTLLLKLQLIEPIRRGIVKMKGIAYVGDKIAVEAVMMAMITKTKK